MNQQLHRRVREARARAAIRSWEYRQRRHAKGVWFRFRRVLADARDAYSISRATAEQLITEGVPAEPVGAELEPPRIILFVSPDRVAAIEGRRRLPVRLGPELLAARYLALVRFRDDAPSGATARGSPNR